MKLARNAIYGLHLKGGKGSTYVHLFHVNERNQVDIAMYTDQFLVKGEMGDRFNPQFVEQDPTYSHDHWVCDDHYNFIMVDSNVTDTRKITVSDYKRMTRKVLKHKAQ